jgi:putative membrane protein
LSLANERTFLAWMRTALAILAAGVLLDQFSVKLGSQVFVVLVSAGLCLVAAILSVLSYIKWRDYEVAMRHKRALPMSKAIIFLVGVVLLLGILLTALILIPH